MAGAPHWLIVAGLLASGCLSADEPIRCDLAFTGGAILVDVPVASTPEQMHAGLSNRDDVGQGMLFTWPESAPRVFWMRDTRVPLSIGFLDDDGRVFKIRHMSPESDDRHYSIWPARDAIEVSQGQFDRAGITVGSRLIARDCTND